MHRTMPTWTRFHVLARVGAGLFVTTLMLNTAATAQIGPNRFSTTTRGDIRIAGNTLGLAKASNANAPGLLGSIGTFLSTDAEQIDVFPPPGWPSGPPGTTATWSNNSSMGPLRLPAGSTVLYAELVWGGSYQYIDDVSAALGTPVTLAYSDGASISVAPDPATGVTLAQVDCSGMLAIRYYARSANVTSFVAAKGSGAYTVGGVPGTQHELNNSLNAAGWCLIVAYADAAEPVRFLAIRVGAKYIDECSTEDCLFTGFAMPSAGPVGGRVVLAAIEGDANYVGDQVLITDADGDFHALSTTNNPETNFFASEINDSDGILETAGTAGALNHDANAGVNTWSGRQGWDVTGVVVSDAAGQINPGQTDLVVRAYTAGDAYVLVGVGVALDAVAAAGVTSPEALPTAASLEAPSPNPLVSRTRVAYSLARPGALELRILDSAGRAVRTLRTGAWPSGPGGCEWDGRDSAGLTVPAGIYFVTLSTGGQRLSRPIVVVR